jgi:hypothetical protein
MDAVGGGDVREDMLRDVAEAVLPVVPALAAWAEERSHAGDPAHPLAALPPAHASGPTDSR